DRNLRVRLSVTGIVGHTLCDAVRFDRGIVIVVCRRNAALRAGIVDRLVEARQAAKQLADRRRPEALRIGSAQPYVPNRFPVRLALPRRMREGAASASALRVGGVV